MSKKLSCIFIILTICFVLYSCIFSSSHDIDTKYLTSKYSVADIEEIVDNPKAVSGYSVSCLVHINKLNSDSESDKISAEANILTWDKEKQSWNQEQDVLITEGDCDLSKISEGSDIGVYANIKNGGPKPTFELYSYCNSFDYMSLLAFDDLTYYIESSDVEISSYDELDEDDKKIVDSELGTPAEGYEFDFMSLMKNNTPEKNPLISVLIDDNGKIWVISFKFNEDDINADLYILKRSKLKKETTVDLKNPFIYSNPNVCLNGYIESDFKSQDLKWVLKHPGDRNLDMISCATRIKSFDISEDSFSSSDNTIFSIDRKKGKIDNIEDIPIYFDKSFDYFKRQTGFKAGDNIAILSQINVDEQTNPDGTINSGDLHFNLSANSVCRLWDYLSAMSINKILDGKDENVSSLELCVYRYGALDDEIKNSIRSKLGNFDDIYNNSDCLLSVLKDKNNNYWVTKFNVSKTKVTADVYIVKYSKGSTDLYFQDTINLNDTYF